MQKIGFPAPTEIMIHENMGELRPAEIWEHEDMGSCGDDGPEEGGPEEHRSRRQEGCEGERDLLIG